MRLNRFIRHALPGPSVQIRILVSRPRFEGINLAKRLFTFPTQADGLNQGLKLELTPNASAPAALNDADFLVIGTERVDGKGDVYTKTGTLAACVLAKTSDKMQGHHGVHYRQARFSFG